MVHTLVPSESPNLERKFWRTLKNVLLIVKMTLETMKKKKKKKKGILWSLWFLINNEGDWNLHLIFHNREFLPISHSNSHYDGRVYKQLSVSAASIDGVAPWNDGNMGDANYRVLWSAWCGVVPTGASPMASHRKYGVVGGVERPPEPCSPRQTL